MVVLEGILQFTSVGELFVWRAKHARHMVLVGKDRDYRLVSTQSKAPSSKSSRPFLEQKSE
jgi:hypothetical protein